MVRVSLQPVQSGESYRDTNYAYKLFFTVCSQIRAEVCYRNSKPQKPTSEYPLNNKTSLHVIFFSFN